MATKFPPQLLTSFHALTILAGLAFFISVLPLGQAPGVWYDGPFLLYVVAFLLGVLGLQVGDAERSAWWTERLPPGRQAGRLLWLVGLGVALDFPFLTAYRAWVGANWWGWGLALLFLVAFGFLWSLVGFAAAGRIQSEGLRFFAKYGGLVVASFVPLAFALPISPFSALGSLWEGRGMAGPIGLVLYATVDLLALGWWIWRGRIDLFSASGHGPGRGMPSGEGWRR
jgi:hypothetical protein